MMNQANRWRMVLAQQIAASYARNPNAEVVMIAGSVGRGTADRFSDIEIDVYYRRPPTMAERTADVEGCGGVLESMNEDDDEWEEQMSVGGFHAATSTFLISTMERYLQEVIDDAQIAPAAQTRLYSLLHAVPVKSEQLSQRWRVKAEQYPVELTYAMLQENLPFNGFWYAEEMLAARDDRLLLYKIFVGIGRQLIHALLGLNRQYLSTPEALKWMDETIAAMSLKPPDLSARIKGAFSVEPVAGVSILKTLIDETMTLVEAHLPEFDTAPYRAKFEQRRPVWDAPPTGLVLPN